MGDFQAVFDLFGINAATTASLAATVLTLVAFLKSFIPSIQGKWSQIVAAALSILFSVKAYLATSASGGPDVLAMIMSSLFVFAGALGGFSLIKKAGGQ